MIKIGFGKDIHKFKYKKPLILGGVKIPFKKGLFSNTDGDVVIHSLIDAIFGALNVGDIGQHFKEDVKGFSSLILLEKTKEILIKEKGKINNIDIFISCEKPYLNSYFDLMKKNIANGLDIEINKISIKAGSNEKLGYIGRKKAIESYSVCLIEVI